MTLYTIGHSTLTLAEFVTRLHAHGITHVADVRSMPGSNRFPHFNQENLAPALAAEGIGYSHHPSLGGRRSPRVVTPEIEAAVAGWTHKSFRSYAAWTTTDEFRVGLSDLLKLDADYELNVAMMCSEAVPWRCHRSILATALSARGYVIHIMSDTQTHLHEPGEWGPAVVWDDFRPTWPAPTTTEKKEN